MKGYTAKPTKYIPHFLHDDIYNNTDFRSVMCWKVHVIIHSTTLILLIKGESRYIFLVFTDSGFTHRSYLVCWWV